VGGKGLLHLDFDLYGALARLFGVKAQLAGGFAGGQAAHFLQPGFFILYASAFSGVKGDVDVFQVNAHQFAG
jgi:hypothetical protein